MTPTYDKKILKTPKSSGLYNLEMIGNIRKENI